MGMRGKQPVTEQVKEVTREGQGERVKKEKVTALVIVDSCTGGDDVDKGLGWNIPESSSTHLSYIETICTRL